MNNRFITIISSIALVSATLSPGTSTPSSATVGGNTLTPKQSTNNPISDVITTMQVPSPSPTTPIIQNITVASPTTTISNSPSVITPSVKNPKSIDSITTKNPNPTTTSAVVNTKSKNSKQQPAGPGTTVRPGASTTTKTTVPDATTEETIETTVPCDCLKYLSRSTDSANKNTEVTTTVTTLPTTVAPQTTGAPLISPATYTPSKTTTNTTTENPTTTITMTTNITKKHTTRSTTTNSSIVTTLHPTTTVSTITTVPITGASITSKPAIPQPTTSQPTSPQPTTSKPTTTQPTTSQPTTPQPTTSQPTTPQPTTSQPTTPRPTTPQPTTSQPTTSQPTTPQPTTSKPTTTQPTTSQPTTPRPTTSQPTTPQPTTSQPTTQSPTLIATPTSPKSTIIQKTVTNGPTASPSKAKIYRREVDMIQHDDEGLVDNDTNTLDIYCMNHCNIIMNETTTEPPLTTTTERPTTTTPRHRSIDLIGKSVVLQLVIVVNDTFTSDMDIENSTVYRTLANQYEIALTAFYRDLLLLKFKKIDILGFSDGSINCNYSLETTAPTNESEANSTVKELRDVKWKKDSLMNLTIDVNKTIAVQKVLLKNDNCVLPINVCAHHEVLDWDKNGNPECKYKCDIPVNKVYCGAHGECSFTYEGSIRCICKDGYSGELCKIPKPTTTTAKPIKPDTIALSKIHIIGIAGGIGGGLVLILLVALCCVYTKLNKAKKRDRFYGYMDNDKEFLHDENSRIENVPDLKNEYTNLGYQTEQDELQMQRFEPEGKNVDYEPGQRQGAYERDDKAYRKVEEPEGGNVLIYQPKHLNGPMERQSGASKFDEVEERSNSYRMMDTDTTYKIRRPTVNSDRNVPYN